MTDPKTRPSADPTRAAILGCAQHLFVEKGFAATSISEIAKAANINQSLIYHHFKNKEDLWISVKLHAKTQYDQLKQYHYEDLFAIEDAGEFITALIQYRFGIYDANPQIRRMIDWQYLESDSDKLIGMNTEFLERIRHRLQQFQKQGQITNNADPDLLFTLIYSATTGFWRSHMDLEKSRPKSQLSQFKQEYVQLCIDSLLHGLIKEKSVAMTGES